MPSYDCGIVCNHFQLKVGFVLCALKLCYYTPAHLRWQCPLMDWLLHPHGLPSLPLVILHLEGYLRGEWKSWLKTQHSENEDQGTGPITSWKIDGETVETMSDFIFGGSKITADGDSSHEIKRRLLLGRKVMTNLDSIFKSRDITLPTKVHLVKAMGFPVVMYGCESWTVKKAERRRLDAFELWC